MDTFGTFKYFRFKQFLIKILIHLIKGVHETSGNQVFKYIIEPALIELPLDKQSNDKLKIRGISCGRAHSVVLTNNGVITFGNNSYGQCGRPIIENENYYGNRAIMQNISKSIELDSSDEDILSASCGQDHTCLLTNKGNVLTFGWSADGQLVRKSKQSFLK